MSLCTGESPWIGEGNARSNRARVTHRIRFANVVTWAVHPWVSLRLWWLERSIRRTERRTIYRGF